MSHDLKSCPFCGFPVTYCELEIVPRSRKANERGIQPVCMNCRAAGPWVPGTVDDEAIAISAWNRRPGDLVIL